MEAALARLNIFMSKCHNVGNYMSWLTSGYTRVAVVFAVVVFSYFVLIYGRHGWSYNVFVLSSDSVINRVLPFTKTWSADMPQSSGLFGEQALQKFTIKKENLNLPRVCSEN